MSNKAKLVKLEKRFSDKLRNISNEMTESLYLFLISLNNDEIEMDAFRFTLDIGKKIFIRKVFASFNHEVLIEYTSNCYDYYTINFNDLTLSDKTSLYYFLSKYGKLD